MLLYDLDETGHMHHVTKIDKPEVVRSIPVDLGELKVLNTLQQFGIFDYKFSVGEQAADEQLYFREYIKKERCKVNMIQLSDVQRSPVKSYKLLLHVPDFKDIKYFDFVKLKNNVVLVYYQTKNAMSFKILSANDLY